MIEKFTQVCVWPSVMTGGKSPKEFEAYIAKMFGGTRVKFLEEVVTLPTPNEPGTGGRHDLFFSVHRDDIAKFAISRLLHGIFWWEDVLSNGYGHIYPAEVLARYPRKW